MRPEFPTSAKPALLTLRLGLLATFVLTLALAQPPRSPTLGDGPWVFEAAGEVEVRVSIVARGLEHPWALAFLPGGDMLVTETPGRLRLIRDGELVADPVAALPPVSNAPLAGLLDLTLHPGFEANGLVYFTYSKPGEDGVSNTLARGRWNGERLVEIEDVFVADSYGEDRGGASRLAFESGGIVYMTIGGAGVVGDERAQDPGTHIGKTLRLTDEGGVPPDNPFVDRPDHAPEVFTLGHRNQIGLAIHPDTGALFASEQGPQGGDELNVLLPGRNYGWPIVTYGRNYDGTPASEQPWRADFEAPYLFWVPSVAVTGMAFYTGDAFPDWRGNLLVGGLVESRIAPSGQVQRIVMNENGEIAREPLLRQLRQRIRAVYEGPDGFVYVLTDEDDGAVLRLEPN